MTDKIQIYGAAMEAMQNTTRAMTMGIKSTDPAADAEVYRRVMEARITLAAVIDFHEAGSDRWEATVPVPPKGGEA